MIAYKNLKLVMLLLAAVFGAEKPLRERLRNAMGNRLIKTCALGAVTLPVAYWYFSGEMTMNTACQNQENAVQYLIQNIQTSPANVFVQGTCMSAVVLNSVAIKDELVRGCTKIVKGSQTVAEWWKSKSCKQAKSLSPESVESKKAKKKRLAKEANEAKKEAKRIKIKDIVDTDLKKINLARQCGVKKQFSETLSWEIEALGSGFFSESIYDLFVKHIPAYQYGTVSKGLEKKLQNYFSGIKKNSGSVNVKIRTLKISSYEERSQGDWGVFDVDVKHQGGTYFYTMIAFKGSTPKHPKDWLANADQNLVYDDVLDTLVPEGFHDSLNPIKDDNVVDEMSLEDEIFNFIAQDRSPKQRNIIITGHSLGGALAKLMATRVKSSAFLTKLEGRGCKYLAEAIKNARVYTFGAPQIFQKEFNLKLSKESSYQSNFIHFVNKDDPISQLQLFYYRKMLGKVCNKIKSTIETAFSKMEKICKKIPGENQCDFKMKQDKPVITEGEINFSDFGHITLLGINKQSENSSSLSSTHSTQDAVEKLRDVAEKTGVAKALLYYLPEHSIERYVEELKNHIQYD